MAVPSKAVGAAGAGADGSARCYILGDCICPGLPGGQHKCQACCQLVHNLCLQHLLGTDDSSDAGIFCGGLACMKSMREEDKSRQISAGQRARHERNERQRAEHEQRQRCGAGDRCVGGADKICAQASCCGSPRHFKCTVLPCQSGCSAEGEVVYMDMFTRRDALLGLLL